MVVVVVVAWAMGVQSSMESNQSPDPQAFDSKVASSNFVKFEVYVMLIISMWLRAVGFRVRK
eukprot:3335047-Amphidinium_carterae.2